MNHDDVPVPDAFCAGTAPDPSVAEPIASIAHGQKRLIEFAFRAGYVQGYEKREDEQAEVTNKLVRDLLGRS